MCILTRNELRNEQRNELQNEQRNELRNEHESIFGPLNFFNLRYIKGGVRGNNNIGIKKCTTNFLWVLNFGQVGGRRENFQNHTATMIFSKMVSNLSILRLKFGEI